MSSPYTDIPFSSPLHLSQEDVTRLLTESSPQYRIELMQHAATGYAQGQFDVREMALAEQIFRLLLNDTEAYVRAALSDKIKDNQHIPRDIVLALAKDVQEVALPVLQLSDVLSDTDLVELVQSGSEINRLVAIAKRRTVSTRVSGALIDKGDTRIISSLLKNDGAQISDSSYQKILQSHSDDNDITTLLVRRSGLPLTVVEKLVTLVSDTLVKQLEQKYPIGSVSIAQEGEQLRETTILKLLDGGVSPHELEELVEQLFAYDRLSASLIITALCRGHFHFFEASLSRMATIPLPNAHALINDRGMLGFKALYQKAGLPDKLFSATRIALTAVQEMAEIGEPPGTITYANRVAQKILHYAEGKPIENLSYILALIRQNIYR